MLVTMPKSNKFYETLKSHSSIFNASKIAEQFTHVDKNRVDIISNTISDYITTNLPKAVEKRKGIGDYRTNPYVLMTSANVMGLSDPRRLADFLLNSKLYMALETSFGKSIESAFLSTYPINNKNHWDDPEEKIAESTGLNGLSREEKAQKRLNSVWREIDKSVIYGDRRYLVSIKSGPNTINDTQVQAMTDAIRKNHSIWLNESRNNYGVEGLDVVIGLTYGTDKATNNKDIQILAKLLGVGFIEEDRDHHPGVLIDENTSTIRVYRKTGKDFWAFIGNPQEPHDTEYIYLEVLLGLAKALSRGVESADIEDRINAKVAQLALAFGSLQFPRGSLPGWIVKDFSDDELFYFAVAMTAFFDDGI